MELTRTGLALLKEEIPVSRTERRRKPTRLPGYDYRTPALYHVVNSTRHGICRFGTVECGIMRTNPAGDMIEEIWNAIPEQFPGVSLDAAVVMPNHHHGVVFIEPKPDGSLGVSLGDIMKWFKTVTSVRYSHGVHEPGSPPYDRRFWHRNYYDHIIRNDRDLDRIRTYIENNPATWGDDSLHPSAQQTDGDTLG